VDLLHSVDVKIYTRTGDDGSTGLFYGGRVAKDDTGPEAYGTVDEAVSALGAARAIASDELAVTLLAVQRDLFVVAAELATAAGNRSKLTSGESRASREMVEALEVRIDEVEAKSGVPTEFVVPGGSSLAALLDVARTVVRRAERRSVTHMQVAGIVDSQVVPYLNRLADLLYVLARAEEATWAPTKEKS
jgi:cob(I)alamin adenosyltransferase